MSSLPRSSFFREVKFIHISNNNKNGNVYSIPLFPYSQRLRSNRTNVFLNHSFDSQLRPFTTWQTIDNNIKFQKNGFHSVNAKRNARLSSFGRNVFNSREFSSAEKNISFSFNSPLNEWAYLKFRHPTSSIFNSSLHSLFNGSHEAMDFDSASSTVYENAKGEDEIGDGSLDDECLSNNGNGDKLKQQRNESSSRKINPKKGEEIELLCESVAFKGMGVCKVVETDFVVFCERALPGERLIARIVKNKRSFAQAFKVKTLERHADYVEAPCQHFPACGGCKYQNLAYEGQLKIKSTQVKDLLTRIGRFGETESEDLILPIVGCKSIYNYRNKMEFSFGSRIWLPFDSFSNAPKRMDDKIINYNNTINNDDDDNNIINNDINNNNNDKKEGIVSEYEERLTHGKIEIEKEGKEKEKEKEMEEEESQEEKGDEKEEVGHGKKNKRKVKIPEPNPKQFALGLHAPRRFDKILPIQKCHIQNEVANEILQLCKEYCEERKDEIPPYDALTHEGFMRHLVIRTGKNSSTNELEIMVNLSTKEDKAEKLLPLANLISARFPYVVSIVNNVNSSFNDSSTGECENLLFGRRFITDSLRGLDFEISAKSFFQTNTAQADILYDLVEKGCNFSLEKKDIILDLFCGTGTIGLSLASKVKHVYGFEISEDAVSDARSNANRNRIQNATFFQGDLNKLNEEFAKKFPPPDVIITDPNRPGMHPKLLKFLLESKARRIVYVSCNPATCARDLDVLCHTPDGDEGCYRLVSIQPVDMFPHTPHIECVCVLDRNVDYVSA